MKLFDVIFKNLRFQRIFLNLFFDALIKFILVDRIAFSHHKQHKIATEK